MSRLAIVVIAGATLLAPLIYCNAPAPPTSPTPVRSAPAGVWTPKAPPSVDSPVDIRDSSARFPEVSGSGESVDTYFVLHAAYPPYNVLALCNGVCKQAHFENEAHYDEVVTAVNSNEGPTVSWFVVPFCPLFHR